MGLAEYMIIAQGDEWGVLHDGDVPNRYATRRAPLKQRLPRHRLRSVRGMKSE